MRAFACLLLAVVMLSATLATTQAEAPRDDKPMSLRELQDLTSEAIRQHRAGDTQKAIANLEIVSARTRQAFGERDMRLAQSLNNLGLLYDVSGSIDRAEKSYRSALEIVKAQATIQRAPLAQLQNNLAAVLLQQCRITDAHALYKRALQLTEQLHGSYHRDTEMVRENVDRLDRYLGTVISIKDAAAKPQPVGGHANQSVRSDISALLQRCMS